MNSRRVTLRGMRGMLHEAVRQISIVAEMQTRFDPCAFVDAIHECDDVVLVLRRQHDGPWSRS